MPHELTFVFGYGSLLRPGPGLPLGPATPCRLRGFARAWNVAMDNSVTVPGYKYYLDAETRERPKVFVTFLSIAAADGHVNGAAHPVADDALALLDRRERNYERHDVTDRLDVDLGGTVWAYVGRADARQRYETGRAADSAVVAERYHDQVRAAFAGLDPPMLAEFDATTGPLEVPLRALERVDVPERG